MQAPGITRSSLSEDLVAEGAGVGAERGLSIDAVPAHHRDCGPQQLPCGGGRRITLELVNGIDDHEWNPATDPKLAADFGVDTLAARAKNREALENRFDVDHDDSPLFCLVSRLTWQKGTDILLEALPHLVCVGARFVLLGSGDRDLEAGFRKAMADGGYTLNDGDAKVLQQRINREYELWGDVVKKANISVN